MAFIDFTVFIPRVIFQAVFHVQITFLGKSLYMGFQSDLIIGFISSNTIILCYHEIANIHIGYVLD